MSRFTRTRDPAPTSRRAEAIRRHQERSDELERRIEALLPPPERARGLQLLRELHDAPLAHTCRRRRHTAPVAAPKWAPPVWEGDGPLDTWPNRVQ